MKNNSFKFSNIILCSFFLFLMHALPAATMQQINANNCDRTIPSNSSENAYFAGEGLQQVAADIIIEAGTNFTLEQIKVNFGTVNTKLVEFFVRFYTNDPANNIPLTQMGDTQAIEPTSITVVDPSFPISYSEALLDLTPVQFMGNNNEDTTYWIAITARTVSGGSPIWEATTANTSGSFLALSQDDGVTWTKDNPTMEKLEGVYSFIGTCDSACDKVIPSNSSENAYFAGEDLQQVAADITVDVGTNFTLEQIKVNFGTVNTKLLEFFVRFYTNDPANDVPLTQIGDTQVIEPTSITVVDPSFPISYSEALLDLTPFQFMGNNNQDTTYWIAITARTVSGGAPIWEATTANTSGSFLALSQDDGVTWTKDNPTLEKLEGVYSFMGNCSPTLSNEDPSSTGLNDIVIFNNINESKITIVNDSNSSLESIDLHDITGKRVLSVDLGNSSISKKTIDINTLQTGVYLLNLKTSESSLVKKIIKK